MCVGNMEHSLTWPSLTACILHLFTPIVHFDSLNQFHVHTYISCWGPEEQSPSLEINFNSYESCAPMSHPSSWSRCPLNEGGGNQWANTFIEPTPFTLPWHCKHDIGKGRGRPPLNLESLLLDIYSTPCPLPMGHHSKKWRGQGLLGLLSPSSSSLIIPRILPQVPKTHWSLLPTPLGTARH